MAACASTPPPTPTGVGSGSPTPTTAAASPSPTPSAPSVAIEPPAVLLPAIDASYSLAAIAHDANGGVLGGSTSWISSDPAVASVDAEGTLHAMAVGTTLVSATVAGIMSDPAIVTVALPVPGALLITDEQVVGKPKLVDLAGEPSAASEYEIVLSGVQAPAAGTILIGSEGRSIGGRVVSATSEGSNARVRLVTASPRDLFTTFAFKNSLDLSTGPYEVDPDLAASYQVEQDGNSFTFTPGAGAQRDPGIVLAADVQGTRVLPAPPPFKECRVTFGFAGGSQLPLALSVPPTFNLIASGSVDFDSTEAATTVAVHATPAFKLSSELEIKAAFEAKVECKLTLLRRKFRVPGWAGLFFGGDVEFGVGFEVGGKVTLLSAKVGGKLEIKPDLGATLDCPATAGCTLSGSATATSQLTPTLQAPSLSQAAFEPAANLFGFVSLEAGNADIEQLQFSAIEAKAGVKLAASLTLEAIQIDNHNPDSGRSKYELAFNAEVGPGIKLGELLTYLGLSKVIPLKLTFEAPLGSSPTGKASADKPRYLPGDEATVTVRLDPAALLFPAVPAGLGLYNVDRVVLLRKTDLLSTEVLAEQTAAEGQTDFTLTFTSAHLLDASELFAFVVTRLLPLDPPKFELGAAAGGPGRIAFVSDRTADHNPQIFVMSAGGTDVTQLTQDTPGRFSSAPAWSPDGTKIAFMSMRGGGNNEIWVMDANGANAARLTSSDGPDGFPSWSPDGTRIAFTRVPAGRAGQLFVMNSDGSSQRPLTDPSVGADFRPAWSPDGKQIAFTSTRTGHNQIYVVDALGSGVVTQLTLDSGITQSLNPSWSPDGKQIVFVRSDGRFSLYTMNADGTGAKPMSIILPGLTYPSWAPDGTQIAFTQPVAATGGGEAIEVAAIFLVDIDGTGLVRLSPTSSSSSEPAWSR